MRHLCAEGSVSRVKQLERMDRLLHPAALNLLHPSLYEGSSDWSNGLRWRASGSPTPRCGPFRSGVGPRSCPVQGRDWSKRVEVAVGDLLAPDSLDPAFEGIEVAYYLVHSMLSGSGFEQRDREAAWNFTQAAGQLKKTVFLGGLIPKDGKLSSHLQSRAEVGRILRNALPVTEFRAGPIIGSGSASFEMLRYLVERLPVMITPKWVTHEVQPIAIHDVIAYLVAALRAPPSEVVDIGADRLSFKRMMEIFAEERGLRRLIIPTPVLAPKLAALWVGLVTPIPNTMAVPIIKGIIHPILADTTKARKLFPEIRPTLYRTAVSLAMERERQLLAETHWAETHWSDALGTASDSPKLHDEEGLIREIRTLHVNAVPEVVFREFTSLGGRRGLAQMGVRMESPRPDRSASRRSRLAARQAKSSRGPSGRRNRLLACRGSGAPKSSQAACRNESSGKRVDRMGGLPRGQRQPAHPDGVLFVERARRFSVLVRTLSGPLRDFRRIGEGNWSEGREGFLLEQGLAARSWRHRCCSVYLIQAQPQRRYDSWQPSLFKTPSRTPSLKSKIRRLT